MKQILDRQIQEKKEREEIEKANLDAQAKMWELDKQNHEEEQRRLREKINKINKENADFLQQQMTKKHKQTTKMNNAEFSINRPLLREANQKLKNASHYDGHGSQTKSLRSGLN